MLSTLSEVRSKLAATSFYPQLFEQAFGTVEITDERISQAMAQFVRSMVSYQSKFDQAVAAGTPQAPNYAAVFTTQEQLGVEVFHRNTSCSGCHATNVQVANNTHNIGLELTNEEDEGADVGRFKTPSLRNVAVRDGFMHDGRFTTLEEVVEFYSSGVQDNPFLAPQLALAKQRGTFSNLTTAEKAALVAFLNTLTDTTFLTSDLFSNPFVYLPGDFDGNGEVNAADLSIWQASFGVDAGGDSDHDGDSDGRDLLAWQRNVGRTWDDLVPLAAIASIPEPSTALLGGMVLIATFLRRNRRARR
jgi:cytochrome c peroxidase